MQFHPTSALRMKTLPLKQQPEIINKGCHFSSTLNRAEQVIYIRAHRTYRPQRKQNTASQIAEGVQYGLLSPVVTTNDIYNSRFTGKQLIIRQIK